MPSFSLCLLAAVTVTGGLVARVPAQTGGQSLDPLIVRGRSVTEPWSPTEHIVGTDQLRSPDTAAMLRDLPGAAVVRNGPQTGIIQLRGLAGDRVAVRVDGMAITPACPNHMDPPLHYAAPGGGDRIELFAGIAPVSAAGDRLGGMVAVARAQPEFAPDDGLLTKGRFGGSFLGSQDAVLSGADLTVATQAAGLRYRGSAATADDLRIPDGTVWASGYDRTQHDLTGAWRTAGGFVAVDAGVGATRDAGTPALPMDMIRDDAWHVGLHQSEEFRWGTLESRLYLHSIDHLMDNFSVRPASGMRMEAPSASRDLGLRSELTIPVDRHKLRVGIDLHRNEFEAEQVAVATGARRDTFHDNRRSRVGTFIDWEQTLAEQWTTRLGLRGDLVTSDAAAVANAIMPVTAAIRADQARFNAADRSFDDLLPAAVAALRFTPDDTTAVELAAAFTSRAPSLVERYLSTPLNASAGLADGRTYLGNLALDPETAVQLALGFKKHGTKWDLALTPFYQSISEYIQGMPIARLDPAGKPVLEYQNIDRAELYGCELAAGYDLTDELSLDAIASYVRGRNRGTGGDLYRIAPLRGVVDLAFEHDRWEAHLECIWAADQNRVATAQGETPTPGYGLLNLRLARTFANSLRVEMGVENLLDKRHADHLGGVNRVGGSDVAVDDRIPGAARFGYASVAWEF